MKNYLSEDSEDLNSNTNYKLFSILVHLGNNASSGHYFVFIKKQNFWYKFNDSEVSFVLEKEVFDHNYGGINVNYIFDDTKA